MDLPSWNEWFEKIRTELLHRANTWIGRQTYKGTAVFYSIQIQNLPAYANNAAAVAGGLVVGDLYRTNGDPDTICVVHA